MKNKQRRTGAFLKNALIEVHLFPRGKLFGLALRQSRFHGELGFWKIEGAFQVQSFRHLAGLDKPFLERLAALCGRDMLACATNWRGGNRNLASRHVMLQ